MEPLDAALDGALIVMRNGGSRAAVEQSFTNTLKSFNSSDAGTSGAVIPASTGGP